MNNVSSGTCTADFLGYIVYFNHCTDYKIRKEKARILDKDKNSARFMGGMIVVYSIFVLIMCSGMKDFITMMIPTVIALSRTLNLYK